MDVTYLFLFMGMCFVEAFIKGIGLMLAFLILRPALLRAIRN